MKEFNSSNIIFTNLIILEDIEHDQFLSQSMDSSIKKIRKKKYFKNLCRTPLLIFFEKPL